LKKNFFLLVPNQAPSGWCVLSDERKTRLLVAQGKQLMLLGEMEASAQPIVIFNLSKTGIFLIT